MAYYFMVEEKKGNYKPLDIAKSSCFPGIKRKYKKDGAFSLEEIDLFTMMFNDEDEMRKELMSSVGLSLSMLDKPLSIRILKNGKYNKLPYDFLYQKDIGYVMDPTKLVELIMKRFYQKDFVFIKKFADYFSGYYECASTAPEIRMYADISIRDGMCYKHFYDIDKNGDNQMKRLIKLLLLDHYEYPDGYISYKDKVNYRNLHMMVAFINNYDKKYVEQETILATTEKTDEVIPITISENKTESENVVEVKTRKRVKKNDVIEGQISIFDFL